MLEWEVVLGRKSCERCGMEGNGRVRSRKLKKSGKIGLWVNRRKF